MKTKKSVWKIPLIIGGVLVFVFVTLASVMMTINQNKNQNKLGKVNNQLYTRVFDELRTDIVHYTSTCHLQKDKDDILIDFHNKHLISNFRDSQWNDHFSQDVNIPAGKYQIYLESFDGYDIREGTGIDSQRHEQYYVKFMNDDEKIAQSKPTEDLKDNIKQTSWKGIVDDNLILVKKINKIIIQHLVPYKEGGEPNSHLAICMVLKPIKEAPVCGDGEKAETEECDDGNVIDGDGCSSVCKNEEASIQLDKKASKTVVNSGETVTYSYRITNVGKVRLSSITLVDDQLGSIVCPQSGLISGASMICVQDTNIYNSVKNIAKVTGKANDDKTVTAESSANVEVVAKKTIKKEKEPAHKSSIGDYIWYDTNGNGIQEDIEEGIPNIKVCAFDGNKKYCDTTDKHGRYRIKDLEAGTYTVVVKSTGGMVQTYDPDGKKDNKTRIKLKKNDKHTKADFGYQGSAPKTGLAVNIALLIILSTLVTITVLFILRKKGNI